MYLNQLSKTIKKFKNNVDESIFKLNDLRKKICTIEECVHEKVNDYIDISPELSQKITYCIKCETTF
jgi:hypothetical protein